MKTQSNSRPLAECTVISCIASWPACAWLSPASSDACVRKAASGDITVGSGASASRISMPSSARRWPRPPTPAPCGPQMRHRVLAETLLRHERVGGVDQLLQVLDAVGAFAFGLVDASTRPLRSSTCSIISGSGSCCVSKRTPSISLTKRAQRWPRLAGDNAHRRVQRDAVLLGARILQLLDASARRCRASGS